MACFSMRKRSFPAIVWRTAVRLLVDALSFVSLGFRSRSRLAAENLFLRKELALYRERKVKPRRAGDATYPHEADSIAHDGIWLGRPTTSRPAPARTTERSGLQTMG